MTFILFSPFPRFNNYPRDDMQLQIWYFSPRKGRVRPDIVLVAPEPQLDADRRAVDEASSEESFGRAARILGHLQVWWLSVT